MPLVRLCKRFEINGYYVQLVRLIDGPMCIYRVEIGSIDSEAYDLIWRFREYDLYFMMCEVELAYQFAKIFITYNMRLNHEN